jgi:hypothetical protein
VTASFATHFDLSVLPVNIGQAQPNDITPTKPQTGQKQDHGLISQSGFVGRTGSDDAIYIF